MKIYHFYHVFAEGQWKTPVLEHFFYLKDSLLLYNIEKIFVGIVGYDKNRGEVKQFLKTLKLPNLEIVSQKDIGWEQETLKPLHDFCILNKEDAVLYAHTKGASKSVNHYPSVEISHAWRREMTFHNITKWQTAIWHLQHENCDTVGILSVINRDELTFRYWAGNFWWAKCDYIAKLPPINFDDPNEAEFWIGKLDNIKFFDMHKGYPSIRHFNNGLYTQHNVPFY